MDTTTLDHECSGQAGTGPFRVAEVLDRHGRLLDRTARRARDGRYLGLTFRQVRAVMKGALIEAAATNDWRDGARFVPAAVSRMKQAVEAEVARRRRLSLRREDVRAMVRSMPRTPRLLVQMLWGDDLTIDEAAAALEIPVPDAQRSAYWARDQINRLINGPAAELPALETVLDDGSAAVAA